LPRLGVFILLGQGCALPIELFPQLRVQIYGKNLVLQIFCEKK